MNRKMKHRFGLFLVTLLIGCGESLDSWSPGVPPDVGAVSEPVVLAEGLGQPRDLVRIDDDLYVVDRLLGRLLRVPIEGGEATEVLTGLNDPWHMATDGQDIVITEPQGGRVLSVSLDGTMRIAMEGQFWPWDIEMSDGVAWWIEQGGEGVSPSVWTMEVETLTPTLLASEFIKPQGLKLIEHEILVTETGGANRLTSVSIENGTKSVVATFEKESPQAVIQDLDSQELFLTTRGDWGGGWVHSIDSSTGTVDPVSYSPRGLMGLELWEDQIIWASRETITQTSRTGGAYYPLAIETAVWDFILTEKEGGPWLIWTDLQRGEILGIPL